MKKEEYILILPKNHHLAKKEEDALKDLKDEYFVGYNNESCKEKISYSEFIDSTPKISTEPSEGSVLSGLVSAGAGIAIILNTPMINTNKLSIIKIKDEIGYKSIYMGWNKGACSSEMKEQFKKYVLNLSQIEVES